MIPSKLAIRLINNVDTMSIRGKDAARSEHLLIAKPKGFTISTDSRFLTILLLFSIIHYTGGNVKKIYKFSLQAPVERNQPAI